MAGGAAGRGLCRHTVPDWARYARGAGAGRAIMAACRLLVNEEEPVEDPRTIGCGYWGRQGECPLYEAPGAAPQDSDAGPHVVPAARRPRVADVPISVEQIAAARVTTDDYAPRGPLTDAVRQRRRATTALLVVAVTVLVVWLLR